MALLLAAASIYGASAGSHLPAGGFEVPGSESDRAVKEAERRFGIGSADVLVLYRDPTRDVRDAQFGTLLLDLLEPVLEDESVVGATTYFDTAQAGLVSRDHHEMLVIVSLAGTNAEKVQAFPRIEPLLRQIEPPVTVTIGGHVAASALAQAISREDIKKAERLALPIAGLLTLLFFRSVVAALLPILVGGFTLASCAAVMRLGAQFTEIAIFALSVSAFLGLGLAIDYSLLMVHRFRQELARGLPVREAVATVLDTAGRAVWVSGLAVIVSLAVLIGCPVNILRSVAIGGVLATLMALLGALVLLPALLAWLGPRVDLGAVGRSPEATGPSPFWRHVGEFSMRHPIATALASAGVLVAIAIPALDLRGVLSDARIFPHGSEVRLLDEALADDSRFDPGGASAMQMIVTTPGSPLEPENLRRLRAYAARIAATPGVRAVRSPYDELDPDALSPAELERAAGRDPVASKLAHMRHQNVSMLVATGENPWRSIEAGEVLEAVRAVPHPDLDVLIGGPTARMVDLKLTLKDYGRVAAVLVIGWNYLMLLFAFRSVVVPLKAVLMNVVSLGASFGLLVWVFQEGHFANLLDFERLEGIDPTIPLIIFAVVFGLSMDYEVFLLTRIREEWLRTGDNRESVIAGLAHTGRIITSAALILLVVIGAFAGGSFVYVKQMGIGIGAAIALDVTLVRALLVPATMQLLGRWNWWAPRWLHLGGEPRAAPPARAPPGGRAPRRPPRRGLLAAARRRRGPALRRLGHGASLVARRPPVPIPRFTAPAAPEAVAAALAESGVAIVERLAPASQLEDALEELAPYVAATPPGVDGFAGRRTRRTGGLVARSPLCREFVAHPFVLDVVGRVLGHATNFHLHLTQLIAIGPGEPAQLIHRDQWAFDFFPFPSGYEVQCNTIWAANDFTEENGATRVIPGSHKLADKLQFGEADTEPAVMPAGSLVFYTGSLYHGAGANRSDHVRHGLNLTYALGWLRQEENQYLSVPFEIARTLPDSLLKLIGYQRGAYALGYVDDVRDPLDALRGRASGARLGDLQQAAARVGADKPRA